MSNIVKTFNIRHVVLAVAVAGLLLSLAVPAVSYAAKPETTGQERAASAGNKATTTDEDTASTTDDSTGDEKLRGLDRAQSVVKKEEIRARLANLQSLLEALKELFRARHGVGREHSAFIHDQKSGTGDDDDDTSNPMLVALLASSTETLVDNDAGTDDDEGMFEMEVQITASSGDLMIPDVASTDDATSTGIVFSVRDAADDTVASGTVSATLTSTATETDNVFTVAESETKTFTVKVTFDPDDAGSYYIQLEAVNSGDDTEDLTPADDFQSDALSI